ncbi:MAG TPA: methyltransferase domain-containing protein [Pyrinomonadaceae bacterium]|jgi:uncharacterized protein YbaR (Trm112 family)
MLRSLRNLRSWWDFPRRHQIPDEGLVIDVGCGHMPNMRANILADKFLVDDAERHQPLALDERPFIVCDALHLPFQNSSVDYIICSHLAEHMEEPEALFVELTRVAHAGYIECPARMREILHGWEFHRWYVEVHDDKLIFEEKTRQIHDLELHEWFSQRFENDPIFENFFVDNMERFNLVAAYDWVEHVNYEIHRSANGAWSRTAAKLETSAPVSTQELSDQLNRVPLHSPSRNERIKKILAKIARRKSDPLTAKRLRSILCCPKCKGQLEDVSGGLACGPCRATFPVVGNVHYLVPEQVAGWEPELLTEVVPAH